ncbi:MAG TPA: DUF58 domain-containing protein [Candidatus Tripitaka californicus]|uniref:DUF58 domain-containing protein n=1 Tax=Candidatus Tripitaka californicus TaxID=3367616 RepID=UPI0040265EB7|nr:DUF58 domain-containing protein [Planctomycetota bacterium]
MFRDLFNPTFLRRLEALTIVCKKAAMVSRKGGYVFINKKGNSIEFADYQAYNPGDDFRYIDWNLYSRLDKLLIKTFKDEIELSVHILLDTSRSMSFPEGDGKFDFARKTALALGYIGLSNQNSTRVVALTPAHPETRSGLHQTPFFQKPSGIVHIKNFVQSLTPTGEADLVNFLSRYTFDNKGKGGTIVLISDFMIPPHSYKRALDILRFKHYDIKVIQVLGPREIDPFRDLKGGEIVDVETSERKVVNVTPALKKKYHQLLENHNQELKRYCHSIRALYTLARTDMDFESLILKELPKLGFVR